MSSTARAPSLLTLSGYAALVLIVAGLSYGGKVVFDSRRHNASASAFAADTVAAMAGSWDAGELIRRAAPEWLPPAEQVGLRAVFRQFSTLGRLKGLHMPSGRVGDGAYPGTRINGVWADYTVVGEFDTGPAAFHLVLKHIDDGWQVAGFQANSPVFEQRPPAR